MAYNPKDKNPSGVVLFGNNGSDQVFESITDFVYDTGNTRLGISTSSPQYTLDVSGTGAFHTIRFADGTEMTTSGGGGGGGGTTYTAGSGLTLDGTEFNVFGGSGNFQYIELKSSTQDPQIYFLGSGSSDTPVTLNILSSYQSASSSGSALVFDGTEGQLFAITDNLSSGVIFSVADIAGLPLIEADASGDVKLIEFGRYVGVGTGTPAYQLDVFGTGRFSDGVIFPDGNRQTIAYTGQETQKIFTITASDSSNYTFDGMGLNSANDPTIYLHKGHTYYFNKQTASHPFVISATDGGSVYQDADGNNIEISGQGTLKFEVPQNAPDKLYYYCNSHASAMKGEIYTTTNIDDIDTISGLLYNHWVISDGSNSGIISSLNTLRFTESGQTSIVFDSGTNTLTIGSTGAGGGGGGGTNWNLSVEGDSTNIGDGETVDFTGQGNITLSRSSNTVIISGAAGGGGGGGGTPGGSNTQVQFNDGGSFGGSPAFTFDGSTVTITGTGLLFDVRNVSADILFSIEDTNESSIIAAAQAGQTGYILDIRDRFDTNIAHIDPSGKLHYQSSFSPISNEGTASSFTFNLDKSNVFSGTLNGASTLVTSEGDVGQRFLVRLKQGSGGSKTVSSWFGNRVSWPGGSAPTLSSTAGHVDLFGFLVTSGTAPTLYYDGFTIATGIQ